MTPRNYFKMSCTGSTALYQESDEQLNQKLCRAKKNAAIGWCWLGEDFSLLRLIGARVIFVGILVIAIAG